MGNGAGINGGSSRLGVGLERAVLVQPFAYPECAWVEKPSAFSAGLADLSSEIQGKNGKGTDREDRDDGTGKFDRTVEFGPMQNVVPERVDEAEVKARVEAASRESEEHGFARGMAAGLRAGRDEAAPVIAAERERLLAQGAALIESLDAARAVYFSQVEEETARLALSIAGRILRRELQMDPLLLTGAVRVALGQLAAATSVRLRVPSKDREMWAEAMALIPRLNPRPQVIGDEAMETGDCRMETELGSVDLGLGPQLREIEQGLFEGASGLEPLLFTSEKPVASHARVAG